MDNAVENDKDRFPRSAATDAYLKDAEGVALLRQIFPDESTDALYKLHQRRLQKRDDDAQVFASNLGKRLSRQLLSTGKNAQNYSSRNNLPESFLRLPPTFAVRRLHSDTDQIYYDLVSNLEQDAWIQHQRLGRFVGNTGSLTNNGYHNSDSIVNNASVEGDQTHAASYTFYTRVIFRDPRIGFGLSLRQCPNYGYVYVYALITGDTSPQDTNSKQNTTKSRAPWTDSGIRTGDMIVGVNGVALAELNFEADGSLLRQVVSIIRESPDPIVLHLQRPKEMADEYADDEVGRQNPESHIPLQPYPSYHPPPVVTVHAPPATPSLLDTTLLDLSIDTQSAMSLHDQIYRSTPMTESSGTHNNIHPIILHLTKYGIVTSDDEQWQCSQQIAEFDRRVRLWESSVAFCIDGGYNNQTETVVPLAGVHHALSIRIVHTFLDSDTTAYTVWVYDAENGREWYAPVRYYNDFVDLRAAILPLHPAIADVPFPQLNRLARVASLLGTPTKPESESERKEKAAKLELFLRTVCTLMYRQALLDATFQVAMYVQSFLGCEDAGNWTSDQQALTDSMYLFKESQTDAQQIRQHLKLSLQRYVYRLLLLKPLSSAIDIFIETIKSREPDRSEMEYLESQGRDQLKVRATKELEQVQTFLDYTQDLIVEGCKVEFAMIAKHEEYNAIHDLIYTKTPSMYWDRLIRDAVREQLEVEIYVPLRSLISQWIVCGWRYEDMEAKYKIKELKKRPQEYFKIPVGHNILQCVSVFNILEEVGQRTLPCAKLRAIVTAAEELALQFKSMSAQRSMSQDSGHDDSSNVTKYLSADDFLPMFIFCVVQAEMERPCALCILLRSLCDRISKIGETGYYFASFEAAISHIQEIDLANDNAQTLSFLDIPLDN